MAALASSQSEGQSYMCLAGAGASCCAERTLPSSSTAARDEAEESLEIRQYFDERERLISGIIMKSYLLRKFTPASS
jgi:hypothetical protein